MRVPDAIAAAVMDSPVAAAIAAMLPATSMVFPVVDVVELVLEEVRAEVTSWPPDVAKTAAAPETAEGGADVVAAAATAVVAAGAVVPRVGTEEAAPVVVLALM